MRIALLAPSPVPFVLGGAEHLWLGLQRHINEETTHACEVFKVPTRENSLQELLRSYRAHAQTDLSHFDRVISTKYPAWMTRHSNHAVYMQHTLRGLYDTYHFCQQPETVDWPAALRDVRQAIEGLVQADSADNGPVFRLIDLVESALESGRMDANFGRFPGPFVRQLVHALDRFAMQPARIASYTAISATVRRRIGYFPPSADVAVIHHPPRLDGFFCAGDDHLFTISRLDGAKRIGLIVEAMRYVKADIPLLIGGQGPDEARLRELAAGDSRIRFLGAMTDYEVKDAYAHALAVPFVPYDEDLGLITIEAMRSGKPVVTVSDAGGVIEFVEHGQTGLCTAPDPVALGQAIDQLCADRAATRAMGHAARQRVTGISWHKVAARLVGEPLPAPRPKRSPAQTSRRQHLAVALTFSVDPPRGGGQSRVYHLYKALARAMDVTLVCLCGPDESPRRQQLAPGLVEARVPKSPSHQDAEIEHSRSVDWVPVTDIVAAREIHRTPAFLEALDAACIGADAVVASHPYFVKTLRERYPGKPLWFEAHNMEVALKREILPDSDAGRALLAWVEEDERRAWQEAQFVFACAQRDIDLMREAYGATPALTLEVPNGFAEDEVQTTDAESRQALKEKLGLGTHPVALFIGSWHGPNLDAVERILGYAVALPSLRFVIVGSACQYFAEREVPANVHMVGVVDAQEKRVFLATADLAINPMTRGSGSNLKMLDYFAAGIPVLSTPFGARGIDAQPDTHYLAAEIGEFQFALVRWLVQKPRLRDMADRAEQLARERYTWTAIGKTALSFIEGVVLTHWHPDANAWNRASTRVADQARHR